MIAAIPAANAATTPATTAAATLASTGTAMPGLLSQQGQQNNQ